MIKVLIVEDEAGIRSSLANAYSWSEMECELLGCAASGIEALEICLKVQPDIIISDIVMPGIDGHDVTLELNLPYPVKSAVLIPQGIKLPVENGRITLPQIDGYEIVSFELE